MYLSEEQKFCLFYWRFACWQVFIWFLWEAGSPYSLDVFEGHLYWIAKERGEVWKKDKFGSGEKVKVLTVNPWLTQVRIYHQHRYNQSGG